MLTDLSFLNIGQQFPPPSEFPRLELYRKNKALFEGEHSQVYKEAFDRIERVIGNFDEVIRYETIVNYHKLISLKVADLLWGEPPKISAGKSESTQQKTVETIVKNTELYNTGNMATIDISRFGDGLLYVYKDGDKGMIDVTRPSYWFPVVDPTNIKRFTQHVLAWRYKRGEAEYLLVRIHEKGFYLETEYLLEAYAGDVGYTIKQVTKARQKFETGLSDFAVIPISNVTTSDRVHGMDDYTDIDSIVAELLVRLGQISKILDKHAEPTMAGSASALEKDPISGEYKFKAGNYVIVDNGLGDKSPVKPEYITWDGKLEDNFKMIEQLVNFLHAISEMGSQILGDKNEDGGALSGTALRFKMVSPLAKVKRIAQRFSPALEKAIVLCSQLGGKDIVNLTDVPISITFQDGLPSDPKEEAEIMSTRTGNKPTMSVKRALQVYDQMKEDDAENELEQIQEEEEAANPLLNVSTPFNGSNEPNNADTGEGDE